MRHRESKTCRFNDVWGGRHVFAKEAVGPFRRTVHGREHVQQGGFPRSRGAEEHHHNLALFQIQIDAVEGRNGLSRRGVDATNAAQFDKRRGEFLSHGLPTRGRRISPFHVGFQWRSADCSKGTSREPKRDAFGRIDTVLGRSRGT